LIGDQNQLPAVTVQSDANTLINDLVLNDIGIFDMKISLFERMYNTAVRNGWTNAYGMLSEQFRMDEKIMQLINHYYHNGLRCAVSERNDLEFIYPAGDDSKISQLLKSNRLIFIETPLSKTGKNNEREAGIVSQLVGKIKQIGLTDENGVFNPGVITPWRAQIATIKQKLEEIGITGVPVDTVERFQGSENKVIIYSTAVSSHFQLERSGSIGVAKSEESEVEVDRKLNVVLSRAQEQIIILGSVSVLKTSLHYKKVLETIINNGRFVPAHEREEIFGT
jgi:DNA replication ATP-dependent helicase Dna2